MQLDNMLIFNPLNQEFKTDITPSDKYSIKRDLTNKVYSTISVYDKDDKLEIYDIIFIEKFFRNKDPLSGMVVNIQKINEIEKQVQFVFGSDVWVNEYYLANNSFNGFHKTEKNLTQYGITLDTNDKLITSNNFLNFDTMCRQALRKSQKIEDYSNLWNPQIKDFKDKIYEVNADDNRLTNLKSQFATDNFNKFTIYNTDDKSQKKVGYLNDGVYSATPDGKTVYTPRYESVQIDNFTDDYIEDKLKSQEYNNKFEFDIDLDTKLEAFYFNNTFLGRRIKLVFSDIKVINTFISGYELKDDNTLHVVLGLTRTRLTELLKKEV